MSSLGHTEIGNKLAYSLNQLVQASYRRGIRLRCMPEGFDALQTTYIKTVGIMFQRLLDENERLQKELTEERNRR